MTVAEILPVSSPVMDELAERAYSSLPLQPVLNKQAEDDLVGASEQPLDAAAWTVLGLNRDVTCREGVITVKSASGRGGVIRGGMSADSIAARAAAAAVARLRNTPGRTTHQQPLHLSEEVSGKSDVPLVPVVPYRLSSLLSGILSGRTPAAYLHHRDCLNTAG
jgi:hypothetical protein